MYKKTMYNFAQSPIIKMILCTKDVTTVNTVQMISERGEIREICRKVGIETNDIIEYFIDMKGDCFCIPLFVVTLDDKPFGVILLRYKEEYSPTVNLFSFDEMGEQVWGNTIKKGLVFPYLSLADESQEDLSHTILNLFCCKLPLNYTTINEEV